MTIRRYDNSFRERWDTFIDLSKNGTFMLRRGFMEYHSDRFQDHSLLIFEKDTLIAVVPASFHDGRLISHGGLTYGGIVVGRHMTTETMLRVVSLLRDYLSQQDIDELLIKRVPTIYYTYPSDEDTYAFFLSDIPLVRRELSSAIYLPDAIRLSERRRRAIRKAYDAGIRVSESTDYDTYITLLTEVLQSRHNVTPPHTPQELRLLSTRFPHNIKLWAAFRGEHMIAGTLLFIDRGVVHTQYLANSEEGRRCGALDLIIHKLITETYRDARYIDFGISTEKQGRLLNTGLTTQKEEFGARAVTYDSYLLKTTH